MAAIRVAASYRHRSLAHLRIAVNARMVPPARVERALPCDNLILSQARLPVPPRGHARRILAARPRAASGLALDFLERRYSKSNQRASLTFCRSMIFSENRFPPRIKSGAGFFGIMLR
jgi:hypothetical protein